MPDYGLTEALTAALKATKGADFVRAPEAAAAEASAARAAPGAGVAGGAQTPSVPSVNPDMPDLSAPKAPEPPAATSGAATPPVGPVPAADAPAAPEAPPVQVSQDSGGAPAPGVPSGVPPTGDSPVAAASTPPAPGAALAAPRSPLEAAVQTNVQRFVSANIGDFKNLDMTHLPNVDTMTTPGGMKAAILQVADDNKDAITAEQRNGPIKNQQMLGLAQDLALNTDVVSQVLTRELGTQLERPETVLAARMIEQNALGSILTGPVEKLLSGTATDEDILDYARQKQNFIEYHQKLAGAMTEQGRGTQVMGIPVGLPPEVTAHVASVLQRANPNLLQEVTSLKAATTPVGMANILTGGLPTRIATAARSAVTRIFVNGILSGPPTWAKIFIGNNFNLAVNTFDIAAAGMVRGTIGLAARLGRFPTAAEGAQMADAFTYAHGVISGGADGLRLMGRVLKTGVSLDNVLRFDPSETSGIRNVNPQQGTTQSILPELQGTYFGSMAKILDTIVDAPGSRAIGSIDELTKTLGARAYRTMMVMREVRNQLLDGRLKPGDEGVIAKQMFENPSPEMLQAEEAWAHRMTFQTPFPPGGPGQAFSSFVANKVPALKFIFPFMRTATNIFKQSVVERTPLAMLSARIRNQLAGGGLDADLAKSRIATGTAVGGMFAWMAAHDQITGDAPKDPKERELWGQDGRQPYSVKVTNPLTGQSSWHSYAWFEPMASIAGITADAANAWSRIYQDAEIDTLKSHTEMYGDMVAHIMGSIITNTANKTFMTGAAKFSEMFSDPAQGFQSWAQDFGTSLVPGSKAIEFARNTTDPYLREAWTLHDKIMNDLPGQSKQLGVAMDLFGQPRMGGGPMGRMSPFPASPVGQDDVTDELHALMDHTHVVPITMPSRQISMGMGGPGKGILGGSGMPLTSQEYSELVEKSRAEPNFDGKTLNLHDKLSQVMNSPVYLEATPAERSAMVTAISNQADQIGRNRLYAENESFRQRITAWADEKARIRALNP